MNFAGIPVEADDEHADAYILTYLVNAYPELQLLNICISNGSPNYISGKTQKNFMALLRKKYGD